MASNKLVWSNAVFLVPLAFAIYWSMVWYVAVLVLSLGFSFVYHNSKESSYQITDIIFALVLIFSNFALLFLGGFTPASIALGVAVVGILAIYIYFAQHKHYQFFHSIFHILSAIICTLCLVVFHY